MAATNATQLNNMASASFSQQELLRYVLERDNLSLDEYERNSK